ncbi:hypothetical protein QBL07_015135 [Gordonia rubripertincta]|uniref:hypothetical protein n=1 Tax=Gordonia rubripertincta TaxID=36822 RepID=UPI0039B48F60
MATGEQAHENPLDELVLTDDDALDLVDGPLEQGDVGVAQHRRVGACRGRVPRGGLVEGVRFGQPVLLFV